ncbi:MAG: hypothetical protein SFU27_07285 [Thermonemataceae bacterium]|nr:hypothetical protein [Thermonemataceae bacterium]
MKKKTYITFVLAILTGITYAQNCFKEVLLRIDTLEYSYTKNGIFYKRDKYLPFRYEEATPIAELQVYPNDINKIQKISLFNTSDFEILDSTLRVDDYFRFKIRFKNLNQSKFLKFSFTIFEVPLKESTCEIPLMPFHTTEVGFNPKDDDELYIGEERTFDLLCNNPENIRINSIFTEKEEINYRTELVGKQLKLHLLPSKLGKSELVLNLSTQNPYIDEKGRIRYDLPTIKRHFQVKGSRLAYLNVLPKDITLEEKTQAEGIEIELDYTRLLGLDRTYRIENQEKKGGRLVAEIFTKKFLSNGKILCVLRPYSLHRLTEGYLYIKNTDEPICITNFNVSPKTIINQIIITHEGNKQETAFYPGETAEVRIEGLSLHKTRFHFGGLTEIASDSLIKNENIQTFRLQVPINITEKEVEIYNFSTKFGKTIPIKEHQKPHKFNFININYGAGKQMLEDLPQTVLYPKTIRDIEISFSPEKIDEANKLFGKQYLSVDITVFNTKGDLIEIKHIPNILVCPDETSLRADFYDDAQCSKNSISLNSILGRKTYDLDGWSRIEMVFRHEKDKYKENGFSKKIEIYLQKKMRFDTEFSFPGGLLIKRGDQDGFSPFGGISLAIIQQLNFYDPNKINRYRPYKVGIGVLANNAFNFSPTATDRDLGIVVLGSLYPTRRDVKLTFPLFAGMGYFLSAKAWFFLVGPGIFVRF